MLKFQFIDKVYLGNRPNLIQQVQRIRWSKLFYILDVIY